MATGTGIFEYMRERDDGDYDLVLSEEGVESVVKVIPLADKDWPYGRPSTEETVQELKSFRNSRLSSTDYTQIVDNPISNKADWATYRQELRDLPTHSNWPNITDDDWPVPPTPLEF